MHSSINKSKTAWVKVFHTSTLILISLLGYFNIETLHYDLRCLMIGSS